MPRTTRGRAIPKAKDYDGKTPLPDARHELFSVLFTTNTLPFYWGHGLNCYAFAYDHYKRIDELHVLAAGPARARKGKFRSVASCEAEIKRIQHTCSSAAARLLISVGIKKRCDFLLDRLGENIIVDRELLFIIQQRRDLQSKAQAIRHYDQRMQRIKEKVEIKHEFDPVEVITIARPEKIKTS